MKTRHSIPLVVLLCALATGAAACGSSGSSTSSSTPPATSAPASSPASSASASTSATSNSSAKQTIAANWTAFFSPKTSVAKRVSLLQDGPLFRAIIKAQAGSALAASASAKVTKVTVTTPTKAAVTYDILVAGVPALKNQSGTAVLEGGTWKVGVASFCGLLNLEKTAGLPAVCNSAG